MLSTNGYLQHPMSLQYNLMIQSTLREEPSFDCTWKKMLLNIVNMTNSRDWLRDTVALSHIQSTWKKLLQLKRKSKKLKHRLKLKLKKKPKNGKRKAKKSMRNKLKILSTELLLRMLILLSLKESMKMNLFGPEENQKSKLNSTKISTKMCLRSQVIHFHTHISLLKVRLNLLVLSLSLKELLMINSKNSMKRSQKSNFMSEKSWSMMSLKSFFPNTWISSEH